MRCAASRTRRSYLRSTPMRKPRGRTTRSKGAPPRLRTYSVCCAERLDAVPIVEPDRLTERPRVALPQAREQQPEELHDEEDLRHRRIGHIANRRRDRCAGP